MNNLLQKFETHIAAIDGAADELLPPATTDELDMAEKELGITFPDDFRALYQWHNGDRGNMFLFGEFRLSPLSEILDLYRAHQQSSCAEWYQVADESGTIKDCIANTKWIQFADNGGNTIVFLDMDPGTQGTTGQLVEACDGETECRYSSVKAFITDITNLISTGQLAWDEDAGCFWETDEESVSERDTFRQKIDIVESAPDFDTVQSFRAGDEVTLVGAIKPNRKTNIHQLYIRNGSLKVTGDIGNIGSGLTQGPPLVKIKVRVGRKTFLGFGSPAYEVISCERVPQ